MWLKVKVILAKELDCNWKEYGLMAVSRKYTRMVNSKSLISRLSHGLKKVGLDSDGG